MKRSNCLFFAVALYRRLRRRNTGVYISMRRSRWGRFPHFLVFRKRRTGSWQVVSYKPTDPRLKKCPPPLFKGRPFFGD